MDSEQVIQILLKRIGARCFRMLEGWRARYRIEVKFTGYALQRVKGA